jgi:hypothetical protein
MKLSKISAAYFLLAFSVLGFNSYGKDGPSRKWVKLFDGKSFNGWHSYLKTGVSPQWQVQNRSIFLSGKGGGDLLTDEVYENFELELQWKISPGGNSGVLFHVQEAPEYKSADVTGPEMQVLDNERHPNAKQGPKRTAGSLFDMVAPSDPNACKPAGKWNRIRIVVFNNNVQYYMNGKKVVEYVINSPEWFEMLEKSKYKGWPGYAKSNRGHIALQDHGDQVWFKNIRIRVL